MTQEQFWERTDLRQARISEIENGGSNLTPDKLQSLAVALGVRPIDFGAKNSKSDELTTSPKSKLNLSATGLGQPCPKTRTAHIRRLLRKDRLLSSRADAVPSSQSIAIVEHRSGRARPGLWNGFQLKPMGRKKPAPCGSGRAQDLRVCLAVIAGWAQRLRPARLARSPAQGRTSAPCRLV